MPSPVVQTETEPQPGSTTIGLRLTMKQLSSDPTVAVTFFIAVLLTGLLLTLTPGLFERVTADALDESLSTASPTTRNLDVGILTRYGSARADDPYGPVRDAMVEFREEEIPSSVQSLIYDEIFVADTPQFVVSPFPGADARRFPAFLTLRYMDGIEENVILTSGRMPEPVEPVAMRAGPDCPPVEPGQEPTAPNPSLLRDLNDDGAIECRNVNVRRFEVAVSQPTLEALEVGVGDRIIISPDTTDQLFGQVPASSLDYRVIVEVSGIIEPSDVAGEYWFGDSSLHRPRLRSNADFTDFFPTALMSPDVHRDMGLATGLAFWEYSFRYLVDADQITPKNVEDLTADLRGLESNVQTIAQIGSREFTLHTGLTELLDEYLERRQLTVSTVSVTLAGLFIVSLSVMFLLAALAANRQRRSTVLLRSRGASKPQLTVTRALQGVVLSTPAVAVAYLAAIVIVPSESGLPLQASVALVAAATTLMVGAGASYVFKSLGSLQREVDPLRKTSPRHVVVELLVVTMAIFAIFVLRRRGFDDEGGSFDLLIAAGPALLAIAVAILTLRIYPLLVWPVAWVGARLKGIVTFVGFKRILQLAPTARLPVTVILLAATMAVFASVVQTSITDGQVASTWQTVGAAHRVTTRTPGLALPSLDLDVATVQQTAEAVKYARATVVNAPPDSPRIADLIAIDGPAYVAVTANTPVNPQLPPWFLGQAAEDSGSEEHPIPVIIVGRWSSQESPTPGTTFGLSLDTVRPMFVVRELRSSFPGVTGVTPTVIAPLNDLRAVENLAARPTDVFVRARADAAEELTQALGPQNAVVKLTSQRILFDEIHDEPFARTVEASFRLTFLLCTGFAVVAAVSSLALMADARRRDFGHLRTLGLNRNQGLALTLIEQMPPVLIATIVGTLLGVATARLLEPTINIGAFTGPGLTATIRTDPLLIATTGLVLIGVVSASVVIFAILDRRQDLGNLVKVGDE